MGVEERERRQYEESKKVFWDNYSVMKTAHDKGIAEGEKIGIEKGRVEGGKKKSIEAAHKMKAKGFTIEDIMDITGLTAEEIASL